MQCILNSDLTCFTHSKVKQTERLTTIYSTVRLVSNTVSFFCTKYRLPLCHEWWIPFTSLLFALKNNKLGTLILTFKRVADYRRVLLLYETILHLPFSCVRPFYMIATIFRTALFVMIVFWRSALCDLVCERVKYERILYTPKSLHFSPN